MKRNEIWAIIALMAILAMPVLGITDTEIAPKESGFYPLQWQIIDQRDDYMVPELGNLTTLPVISSWEKLNETLVASVEEYRQIKAAYSGNDSEARALASVLNDKGLHGILAICKWQDYQLPLKGGYDIPAPVNIADGDKWQTAAIVADGYDSVLVQIKPDLTTEEILRWSIVIDPATKKQVVTELTQNDAIGAINYSEMTTSGPKQMGLFYI